MIDSIGLPREVGTAAIQIRHGVLRAQRAAKRVMCVLMGGHWQVLHTTRDSVCLRCVACGHSSPGWQVGKRTARG